MNDKVQRLHDFLRNDLYMADEDIATVNCEKLLKDKEFLAKVRAYKTAAKDWVLINFDYSQLEVYVFAQLSQDETIIHALNNGLDIHSETARKVFNLPTDANVKKDYKDLRDKAKAVTFLILYGGSEYGLGARLGMSDAEAKNIIQQFFLSFPGARRYVEEKVTEAHKFGYVTNVFKRKRKVVGLETKDAYEMVLSTDEQQIKRLADKLGQDAANKARSAYRICLNTPIQGTASDIVLIAMLIAQRKLRESGLRARFLLNIHDAILLETHKDDLPQLIDLMQTAMEKDAAPKKFVVSLKVEYEIGTTYHDMLAPSKAKEELEKLNRPTTGLTPMEMALDWAEQSRIQNHTQIFWREVAGGVDKLIAVEKYKNKSTLHKQVINAIFREELGRDLKEEFGL